MCTDADQVDSASVAAVRDLGKSAPVLRSNAKGEVVGVVVQ